MNLILIAACAVSTMTLGRANADMLVATHTIRALSVLTAADMELVEGTFPETFDRPEDLVGLVSKVSLYAGHRFIASQIGPPAVIARNAIIELKFQRGALLIMTEGRALENGHVGDVIRAMNTDSKAMVFGRVLGDGSLEVGQ